MAVSIRATLPTIVLSLVLIAPGGRPAAGQTAPPASDQQPPVTFRLEVNYVEVDAIVTDEDGRFVGDLRQQDFQIFEDGKPQTISTFAKVDIPIERAEAPLFSPAAIEPDVRSNAEPFDGRLYIIVLDDLHTNVLRSPLVRAAARAFIERNLGANDIAAVLTTGGRTQSNQELTSSKRLLLQAVDRFMGRKLRSPTAERIDQYYRERDVRERGSRFVDPTEAERGFQARNALDTLRRVAE